MENDGQELTELKYEIKRLNNIIAGVQGALADAETILAIREDDDYGESIRMLTAQRDNAVRKLAAWEQAYPHG